MALTITVFKAIDMIMNRRQNNCPLATRANEVVVTADVVYSDRNKNCKLDTYVIPKDEGLYPVLFYIHGGGFVAGGKKFRRGVAEWFASNGFFVINSDYGLCPETRFPEPVRNLADALNFVVDHAEEWRLDTSKIIVAGDSAGGYYSAMLTAVTYSEKLQTALDVHPKTQFAAVILNCGLYDMQLALKSKMPLHLERKLFTDFTGIKPEDSDKYEYAEFCSPAEHVTKDFPPTFVVYSKKDLFCPGQSELLLEAFKKQGVKYETVFSTKMTSNHCYCLEWKSDDAKRTNEKIMQFALKQVNK